jgi:plasmid stabilization system protein ParE
MAEVRITVPAERSLNHIVNYYFQLVSFQLAFSVADLILDRIDALSAFHGRGRVFEELRGLNQNHRYIMEGTFKIIYK